MLWCRAHVVTELQSLSSSCARPMPCYALSLCWPTWLSLVWFHYHGVHAIIQPPSYAHGQDGAMVVAALQMWRSPRPSFYLPHRVSEHVPLPAASRLTTPVTTAMGSLPASLALVSRRWGALLESGHAISSALCQALGSCRPHEQAHTAATIERSHPS